MDDSNQPKVSIPTERVLTERDIATLLNLMHNFSDKWHEIGLGLGFVPSELRQISSNPSLFMHAPASFLHMLLEQWVQWPTKDHPTKPTLKALCEALRGSLVGLGRLAEQVERELKCFNDGSNDSTSCPVGHLVCPLPEVLQLGVPFQESCRRVPHSQESCSQESHSHESHNQESHRRGLHSRESHSRKSHSRESRSKGSHSRGSNSLELHGQAGFYTEFFIRGGKS